MLRAPVSSVPGASVHVHSLSLREVVILLLRFQLIPYFAYFGVGFPTPSFLFSCLLGHFFLKVFIFTFFLSFLLLILSALKINSTKNKKKIFHFKPKSACLAYSVFILFLAQACMCMMVVLGRCQRHDAGVIRFLQIKPI